MKVQRVLFFLLVAGLILSACQPQGDSAVPTDPLDTVRTEAAKTVAALSTQIVAADQIARTQTAVFALPSATPPATQPLPDPTLILPTDPPLPTAVLQPSPTPARSCDEAVFIDETVPDGSQFPPGTVFTKTWTLRNAGSCAWTDKYAVVFSSGDAMNAPAVLPLTKETVPPGGSLTISIPFTSPLAGGAYRADFKLRNAEGVLFSFRDPSQTFWVEIQVVTGKVDLVAMACSIRWSNASEDLPCPGLPTDARGCAYTDFAPLLENATQDDEPAIWLGVQQIQDGILRGSLPVLLVPENARFSTVLGCAPQQKSCSVVLRLSYQQGNDPPVEIASWQKAHDGTLLNISQDLSALSGKSLRFILQLEAKGSPQGDTVHLLAPIIAP